MRIGKLLLTCCAIALLPVAVADAHFSLLLPASSLSNETGGKGAPPCGEGTPSNVITKAQGGHPLAISLSEYVIHPGHYRIALSVNSRDQLPMDPETQDQDGRSISAVIQNPVIPVLADGLFVHDRPATPQAWKTEVMLPNITCAHCTLQVIEFMAQHGLNPGGGFFYHHCADLEITADPKLPKADAAWLRLQAGGR